MEKHQNTSTFNHYAIINLIARVFIIVRLSADNMIEKTQILFSFDCVTIKMLLVW